MITMQNKLILSLIVVILFMASHAQAQRLIAAKPAQLQVFGKFLDGTEVTAESRSLKVLYDPGLVKGELSVNTLSAMDVRIREYLQDIDIDKVYFEVMVEEGAFRFGKSLEEKFQSEGEIIVDNRRTRFIMNFIVTNRAMKGVNTFQLVCTAELSLREHFNLTQIEDMEDRISFQYLLVFWPSGKLSFT